MLISDTVAIALITSITTAVTTIVGAVVTVLTRRKIKQVRDEIREALRKDGDHTRSHIEIATRHPDDLPVTDYSQIQERGRSYDT